MLRFHACECPSLICFIQNVCPEDASSSTWTWLRTCQCEYAFCVTQSWWTGCLAYKHENAFKRPQNFNASPYYKYTNTHNFIHTHNKHKSIINNIFVMEHKWAARYMILKVLGIDALAGSVMYSLVHWCHSAVCWFFIYNFIMPKRFCRPENE